MRRMMTSMFPVHTVGPSIHARRMTAQDGFFTGTAMFLTNFRTRPELGRRQECAVNYIAMCPHTGAATQSLF